MLPTLRRLVALTFDAGANDAGLPKIAATLRRLRVPATFFMTGHFARFYPGWARGCKKAIMAPSCGPLEKHD